MAATSLESSLASGTLLHEVHELLRFFRGETEVVGDAVPVGDTDREPAGSSAESGLALGKRAEGMGSGEFRHDCDFTTQNCFHLLKQLMG